MFLYFSESDFTICGFSTAIEPIIKLFIPRSKYLNVQEGDFVKKDQILCKLSTDSRKAKLDEAKALMLQKKLEWDASKVLVEKGYRSQTKAAGSKAAYDASKALVIQMEEELENINIRL